MKDSDPARARKLIDEAGGLDKLSMESVGWLWPTLAADPVVAEIRRHVQNRATETAGAAHFTESYSDGAYVLLHSDRRADGILLEALIGDQPRHPNICAYHTYDICPIHGPYILMDYAGTPLTKEFGGQPASPDWVLHIGRAVADALDYVHQQHMMHADVNPGNILIGADRDRTVRLTDFGISAALAVVRATDGHQTRLGTSVRGIHLKYSAPEVAGGSSKPASDQWSLALVMLELLLGQGDRLSLLEGLTALPREWRSPLKKALSLSPPQRYPTCSEFVGALPHR